MQTPKTRTSSSGAAPRSSPRSVSSEVSQKNSPKGGASSKEASQKISPRVVRQLKTGSRYSDHTASSSNLASKAPKEKNPKVADRRSPQSPASEKKRPNSKVSELESQISQLEHDLKIVKDQLCSTEASKKQAQKDVEESNQQLLALSEKLEESQKQLLNQSSESHNSDALATALDEIKNLKAQLETAAESEAAHSEHSESAQNELQTLKHDLAEANLLLEEMKRQLSDCKESEARAEARVGETLVQLETAKKMVETLKSGGLKTMEAYDAVASELEQSRARVKFLEELVGKLKAEISNKSELETMDKRGNGESLEIEVSSLKLEVKQLKSTLEAAEIRYNEERAQSNEQIKNAFEMVEKIKSASGRREAELEAELRKSKYEIEELKANLMDKETELQGICEENEGLRVKLEGTLSGHREQELDNLRARFMENEKEWQKVLEENEKLKNEMSKGKRVNGEVDSDVDAARAAEREALMKVGYMTEEVDKSNKKAARVAEQLEAAQAVNAEMEAELRRIKVQSDQWRKAAEAAAAMVSAGNNNGQIMERTGSMDSNYSPRTGKMSSPYADEFDDKKTGNKLRRFGVLWKKPQK